MNLGIWTHFVPYIVFSENLQSLILQTEHFRQTESAGERNVAMYQFISLSHHMLIKAYIRGVLPVTWMKFIWHNHDNLVERR